MDPVQATLLASRTAGAPPLDTYRALLKAGQSLTVYVPVKGKVTFSNGGSHAMIFGIDPTVKPGDPLPLHFAFQSGAAIDVDAHTIGAADEMPMEHGDH